MKVLNIPTLNTVNSTPDDYPEIIPVSIRPWYSRYRLHHAADIMSMPGNNFLLRVVSKTNQDSTIQHDPNHIVRLLLPGKIDYSC